MNHNVCRMTLAVVIALWACAFSGQVTAQQPTQKPAGDEREDAEDKTPGGFKPVTKTSMTISNAYMYVPPKWLKNGFPNMTLTNGGRVADKLVRVDCRRKCNVHLVERVFGDDWVDSNLVESIDVEPGRTLVNSIAGRHAVFLLRMKPLPKAGEHVWLDLVFESVGTVTIAVPVVARSGG